MQFIRTLSLRTTKEKTSNRIPFSCINASRVELRFVPEKRPGECAQVRVASCFAGNGRQGESFKTSGMGAAGRGCHGMSEVDYQRVES
jgi:hypothetical protein